MSRYATHILCLSLVVTNLSLGTGKTCAEPTTAAVHVSSKINSVSNEAAEVVLLRGALPVKSEKKFTVVNFDAIDIDVTAREDLSFAAKNDVANKIRDKYIPVRISIINKSGKLLQIPRENVYFLNSKGEKVPVPSEAEIFQKVKRNGIGRALAWGVPLGVVSFGILAVPAIVWSGAHTKITNGGDKANIKKNNFHGIHLSPEGSVSTMLFIPKDKSDVIKIVLGRVIAEDEGLETEKVVDIDTIGPDQDKEKKSVAKKL